jgi:hypothetical protein
MRLALLLPVLFSLAAPAYAEGARESRYGPTAPRQASPAAAAAAAAAAVRYDGPMLGWANKRQPQPIAIAPTPSAPAPAPAPAQPAPLAPWAGYQPAPVAPMSPPAAAPAAAPATPRPTPQATPTSLYAPPRPAPSVAASPIQAPAPALAPVKDWSSYRSPRVTATAAPAASPHQVAAAGDTTGARYYSVDRDYGLTPDAAPRPTPDNRVLVTAAEPPPEPKDAVPLHGSADWLAAGARGDDDNDDSAARRAKTRNEDL